MKRKIVMIDADKCNGCGQCVTACVEGAIALINGKAQLVSDSYCDGLGACLGHCPADAITIEEREAVAFNEKAAMAHAGHTAPPQTHVARESHHVCPGAMSRRMARPESAPGTSAADVQSELTHWPVQLKLVSPSAPALQGADLLLTADCVPFAMPDFHQRFLRGRSVVVGCPKLDDAQYYVDKLTQILQVSGLRSITVIHMEVPCCSGLTRIAEMALAKSGKHIPAHDVTISIEGKVLREE